MLDSDLIDGRYRDLPVESVADYDSYWYWDEGDLGEMGSQLQGRFIGFTEFDNTFPLAIMELDRPLEFRGVQYSTVMAGSMTPPNTVRWVFRWPLPVNLIAILGEETLRAGPLSLDMVHLLRVGYIEPIVFEGSPHWSCKIPGGLGQDVVWMSNSDGSLPIPRWVPPGKWRL